MLAPTGLLCTKRPIYNKKPRFRETAYINQGQESTPLFAKCSLKTEQRRETKLKEMCELVSVELRQQFKPSVY